MAINSTKITTILLGSFQKTGTVIMCFIAFVSSHFNFELRSVRSAVDDI